MSLLVYPSAVRGLTFTTVKAPSFNTLIQSAPNRVETRLAQTRNPTWKWQLIYDYLKDKPLDTVPSLAYTDLQTMIGFFESMQGSYDDFLYSDPDDNFVGPGIITAGWLPVFPYAYQSIVIAAGHAQQIIAVSGPGATSGTSTPTWSTTGGTVVDGGFTWLDLGAALSGGTLWPNPQAQLQVVTDGTNFYSPIQIYRGGQFYEDISDLNGPLTVYENGVIGTHAFSVGWGGLSVGGSSYAGLFLNWGTNNPNQPVTVNFNYYYRCRFSDDTQDFEKFLNQIWTIGGAGSKNGSGQLKFQTSRTAAWNGLGCPPVPGPPPIALPAGATKFAILWPSALATSQGSAPGIGFAGGIAGVNACGVAELIFQGLGSSGGSCTFSGWALPANIAPSAVKAVYAYCPYIHPGGVSGLAFASLDFHFNSSTFGGVLSNAKGNFLVASSLVGQNLVQLDTVWTGLGHPMSTFPYSSISIVAGLLASINGNYFDFNRVRPMIVIYY
jgi:hypothetical protein